MVKFTRFRTIITLVGLYLCVNLYAKDWMYSTPEEYIEASKNYIKLGQHEKAEEIMAEMFERYPTNPEALYFKAGLLYHDEKYEEAEKYFQLCIKYDPGYTKAYRYLGAIASRKNLLVQAEEYYKKAIELDLTTPAHLDLAELYALQDKYDLAEKEIDLYFKYIDKPSQDGYIVAAYIHRALGQDEKVIEDCEKGLFETDEGNPGNADLWLTLAKTYEKIGDVGKAWHAYQLGYGYNRNIKEFKDGFKRLTPQLTEKVCKENTKEELEKIRDLFKIVHTDYPSIEELKVGIEKINNRIAELSK